MNYINGIQLKENNGFNAIVEIPKGTNSKYELVDKTFDKIIEVRKVIGKYPFYYGCFPQTYAGDKDPLDMILLTKKKYTILSIVNVQPIAVIKTIDNGEVDDKVICVTMDEDIKVEKHLKKALKFLKTYKGKNSNTIIDPKIYCINETLKTIEKANKTFINRKTSASIKIDI